jgi:protein gp37
MGENSKIQWTHHTFNPWRGCVKVSDGCAHCYAEALSKRWGNDIWGVNKPRIIASESYWKQPVKWNREAEKVGERRRVFCASLADVFEDRPDLVEPRARLFQLIAATPMLDWLLLTKRPENINRLVADYAGDCAWLEETINKGVSNVWLGTTVENHEHANKRIPWLLDTFAPVKFLSCEPLLGPVDLMDVKFPRARMNVLSGYGIVTHGVAAQSIPNAGCDRIDWVIVGGESGHGARPMNPDWARALLDQCQDQEAGETSARRQSSPPDHRRQFTNATVQGNPSPRSIAVLLMSKLGAEWRGAE